MVWVRDWKSCETRYRRLARKWRDIKDEKLKSSGKGADELPDWRFYQAFDELQGGATDTKPHLIDTCSLNV